MSKISSNLPVIQENDIAFYMEQIKKFPILDKEEEQILANRWIENGDIEAAHKLVTSHLRLVVKMAVSMKGYGLPVTDIIAEGNIGLMQAVKNYDPKKGFRLSTYAMWWIKASMNEYILRSWSLVKMGTTAAQKKLFFNLRKVKNKILSSSKNNNSNKDYLNDDDIDDVAQYLNVPKRDVLEVEQRMSATDQRLNAPISDDGEGASAIDYLADTTESHELVLAQAQEQSAMHKRLDKAMLNLNDRERDILFQRKLVEPVQTLDVLSKKYNISKERVRQIENRAMDKMTKEMLLTKDN